MILKTTIDWLQNKPLSEEEIAKREVLGPDYKSTDDYDEVEKSAIIDTSDDKLYIEIEPNKICMTKLLGGEFIVDDNDIIQRMEERLYFKCTLAELFENLMKDKV